MKLILCKCEQCRLGRKKNKKLINARKKCARQEVRMMLKKGFEELPLVVYIGYLE